MKLYTPEQIVEKLRQADVELGVILLDQRSVPKIGVTDQTYYRWRKKMVA